ncbi:hypothetical protein G3A56_01740 [Rhizobium oryzihabitans]|uniref:HeH/LEM domain-containing protein n=1 Tax=Rhizobium oryzihabitans TaxID=2267833 RepID=A0A7L5BDS4_9HYPH|nr:MULTISPECIES: hypothetical protein [Rhizobium/Agrobacterium group]QIB36873.1 hypothetical protein G3A56_01740 [Rhizobium oryzihabitans]TQN59598.1 hypothetical protein FLX27_22050 [Agrobacterium tumefaciens]
MTKEREIAYEPHPVSPERKAELRKAGYKIIDARFNPDVKSAPEACNPAADIGTDSGEQFSDEQLREIITKETGEAPHPRLGRKKLIEQFNALNAAAHQEETASNGLSRREIEADLSAMEVEFDPTNDIEDLAALRDLSREERNK